MKEFVPVVLIPAVIEVCLHPLVRTHTAQLMEALLDRGLARADVERLIEPISALQAASILVSRAQALGLDPADVLGCEGGQEQTGE